MQGLCSWPHLSRTPDKSKDRDLAGGPQPFQPHETTTPRFPETQAERPAVLPDSQRVKVGQLSWVGSGRERLVSRKRVGESNSWAGSSHRWVGVGRQAFPFPPSRHIFPPGHRHKLLGVQGPGTPF